MPSAADLNPSHSTEIDSFKFTEGQSLSAQIPLKSTTGTPIKESFVDSEFDSVVAPPSNLDNNCHVQNETKNDIKVQVNGESATGDLCKSGIENSKVDSSSLVRNGKNILENTDASWHAGMEGTETSPSIVDVIKKKRDKLEWSRRDVRCFVQGATYGRITEAQIGAGLMAICLNGMTDQETSDLTQEMINTGRQIPRPHYWPPGSVVGKHSTGGVGDKVTIALSPALAACGLKVPKLSGRGLGHTGGTLDKLESIPGFRVLYGTSEVIEIVDRVGCCIVGVSEQISPADKILYAIRDTTGTTESLPLVAGSVMCKKAAESLDSLALEVTYGRAALIKTREEAVRLSRLMIETGKALNIRTAAVLVRMDNVLGRAVGNSLEIEEAVTCMHGRGPTDVIDVCCALGSYLLEQAGVAKNREEGQQMIRLRLEDGSAAIKFYEMMVAQGVNEAVAKRVAKLDLLTSSSNHSNSHISFTHSNGAGTKSYHQRNQIHDASSNNDLHISDSDSRPKCSDSDNSSEILITENQAAVEDVRSDRASRSTIRPNNHHTIAGGLNGHDGKGQNDGVNYQCANGTVGSVESLQTSTTNPTELNRNGAMTVNDCADMVTDSSEKTLSDGSTVGHFQGSIMNSEETSDGTHNGNAESGSMTHRDESGSMTHQIGDRSMTCQAGDRSMTHQIGDRSMIHQIGDRSMTHQAGDGMDEQHDDLPRAAHVTKLLCQKSGYISAIDAYTCGHVVRNLGAGRSKPADVIDYAAGLRLLIDLGQRVTAGDAWVEVHYSCRPLTLEMIDELQSALHISPQPPQILSVIDTVME